MKHKHAELIKAWADGAKIQYLGWDFEAAEMNRNCGKKLETRVWLDCDKAPNWYTDFEYRIKPNTSFDIVLYISSSVPIGTRSNERKSHHNVKLTYDGMTGDIKSSEVIK